MALDTVTIPPDHHTDTGAELDVIVWVRPATGVEVKVGSNGASIVLDAGRSRLRLDAAPWDSGLRPAPALDILEQLLCRALTALTEARNGQLLETVKKWECGGTCYPSTWTHDNTWVCSETDGDYTCGREQGHPGDHIACTKNQHAAHTWARKAA